MNVFDLLLHPATVHIPIGALIAGCCFVFVAYYKRHAALEQSTLWLLQFSWFALIPSLITGTVDAVRHLENPLTPPDALPWINTHAVSAIGLFVMVWRAWQLRRRMSADQIWVGRPYRAYLVHFVLITILVIISGWSGGYMVYTLQLGR